jgi:hypothetical protein
MRADRTIGIHNRHRHIQHRLKTLPDIQPLGLAADQHRYRLELAHHQTRRLGRRGPRRLRAGSGFTRRRRGVELRLQLGLGGVQLRLQLDNPGCRLRLVAFSPLPGLARDGGAERRLGGCR